MDIGRGFTMHDPERRATAGAGVPPRPPAVGRPPGGTTSAYATVVAAGVLVYLGDVPIGWSLGPYPVALLLALVPPIGLILADRRCGPLASARDDGRWSGPALAALVGAAAGLAAGAIAETLVADRHGCGPVLAECGPTVVWAASTLGPVVAVGLTAAVLAVLKVRHAFFIALLGVTGVALVVTVALLVPDRATPGVPMFVAAGTAAGGLAGVAHARNLPPAVRWVALALLVAAPAVALVFGTAG